MGRQQRSLLVAAAASALLALGLAGCHLALGLETAETIDPAAPCNSIAECDDNNPCTDDSCAGTCVNTPLSGLDAPADLQVQGDCARITCVAGEAQSAIDDNDIPDDGSDCTTDSCGGGVPNNNALPGGTQCTQNGGKVCNAVGQCVECQSNQDCIAPNSCGGNGTPGECGCTPTQSCVVEGLTCGFIVDMTCGGNIACNNNMKDGNETDVDCGGNVTTCSLRCGTGKACLVPNDCASGDCSGNVCAP